MLLKKFLVIISLTLTFFSSAYCQVDLLTPKTQNIEIHKIIFVGDETIFSLESFYAMADAYKDWLGISRDMPIRIEHLLHLKRAMNQKYKDAGYINSEVIIDQLDEKNRICQFRVVEGKLTKVIVLNSKYISKSYIANFFFYKLGDAPLNMKPLEILIKRLKEIPGIQKIDASLEDGVRTGESYLRIKIYESFPFHISALYNNFGTEGTGKYRGILYANYTNLLGYADTLTGQYGLSEGTEYFASNYTFPIFYSDLNCTIGAGKAFAEIITDHVKETGRIWHNSKNMFAKIRYLLYKNIYRRNKSHIHIETSVGVIGEHQKSTQNTFHGLLKTETELFLAKVFHEFMYRERSQVFYISSRLGMPVQSKRNDKKNYRENRFHHWETDITYQKYFFKVPIQIDYQLQFDFASKWLPSSEKSSIGGYSSVRGYEENLLIRDCCVISRLEGLFTLFSSNINIFKKIHRFELKLSSFFDYGQGWNLDLNHNQQFSDRLMSIGTGLQLNAGRFFRSVVYWGHALTEPESRFEKIDRNNNIHFFIKTHFF